MNQKTVIAKLDALLIPLGFARQKFTWNRRSASVVDVVDVQLSKAGDAVTVNAGVLDPEVHVALWGSKPPETVEQPTCTVCARADRRPRQVVAVERRVNPCGCHRGCRNARGSVPCKGEHARRDEAMASRLCGREEEVPAAHN